MLFVDGELLCSALTIRDCFNCLLAWMVVDDLLEGDLIVGVGKEEDGL